jgi:predicted NUDIX family phosphoesterase
LNKYKTEIMVVDRATMFASGYFQGFSPADDTNYYDVILDNYSYEVRDTVENQPSLKQPIAYCVIVNKTTQKIFAYQRASKEEHYKESRLQGKWSWGIGGHIDKADLDEGDPIVASMLREIKEEVTLEKYDRPEIVGYINDDMTDVGKVHFGLLFLIRTAETAIKPRDNEIAWGGFMSIAELEEIYAANQDSVETWSGISLEPIRRVLKID